jgi:hypothetical protein
VEHKCTRVSLPPSSNIRHARISKLKLCYLWSIINLIIYEVYSPKAVTFTCRNVHIYDENLNEDWFLWRFFCFVMDHWWRSTDPVSLWRNQISSQKFVNERHKVLSQITRATVPALLWRSALELWWPELRH